MNASDQNSNPKRVRYDLHSNWYHLLRYRTDDIAALTTFEYKEKLEKILRDILNKIEPEFADAKIVPPTRKDINSLTVGYNSFWSYDELLEEATILKIVAERAYKNESGRLHRSLARISIEVPSKSV